MTREELDRLVDQYLHKTFDEIEDTLALEWSEAGLIQYSGDLNDRAHELSAALSFTDVDAAMDLAREMAPGASIDGLRKLARRLIEVQLRGIIATLKALSGEPLERPLIAPPPASQAAPQATLRLSELAQQYGDERVARKSWSARTEFQVRG